MQSTASGQPSGGDNPELKRVIDENPLLKQAREIKDLIKKKQKEFTQAITKFETKPDYTAEVFNRHLRKSLESSHSLSDLIPPQNTVAELKRQFEETSAELEQKIDREIVKPLETHLSTQVEQERKQREALEELKKAQKEATRNRKKSVIKAVQEVSEEYKNHLISKRIWGDEQSEGFKKWRDKGFHAVIKRVKVKDSYELDPSEGTGQGLPFDERKNTEELAPHPAQVGSKSIDDIIDQNSEDAVVQFFNQIYTTCKHIAKTESWASRWIKRTTSYSYAFNYMKKKRQELIEKDPKHFEIKEYPYTDQDGRSHTKRILAIKESPLIEDERPSISQDQYSPSPSSPSKSMSRSLTSPATTIYSPSSRSESKSQEGMFSSDDSQSEHIEKIMQDVQYSDQKHQASVFRKKEKQLTSLKTEKDKLIEALNVTIQKMERTSVSLQEEIFAHSSTKLGASLKLEYRLHKISIEVEAAEQKLLKIRQRYRAEADCLLSESKVLEAVTLTFKEELAQLKPHRQTLEERLSQFKIIKDLKKHVSKEHKAEDAEDEEAFFQKFKLTSEERHEIAKRMIAFNNEYDSAIRLPRALTKLREMAALKVVVNQYKQEVDAHVSEIKLLEEKVNLIYNDFGKACDQKSENPYPSQVSDVKWIVNNDIKNHLKSIREKKSEIKKSEELAEKKYLDIKARFESIAHEHANAEFYEKVLVDHKTVLDTIRASYDAVLKQEKEAEAALERSTAKKHQIESCDEHVTNREQIASDLNQAKIHFKEFKILDASIQEDFKEVEHLATLGQVEALVALQERTKENCALADSKVTSVTWCHQSANRGKENLETLERMEREGYYTKLDDHLRSNHQPSRDRILAELKIFSPEVKEAVAKVAEYKQKQKTVAEALATAIEIRKQKENADLFIRFFYDFVTKNPLKLQEDVAYKWAYGGVPVEIDGKTYRFAAGVAKLYEKAKLYKTNTEDKKEQDARIYIREGQETSRERIAKKQSCCLFSPRRGSSTSAIYELYDEIDEKKIDLADIKNRFLKMRNNSSEEFTVDLSILVRR